MKRLNNESELSWRVVIWQDFECQGINRWKLIERNHIIRSFEFLAEIEIENIKKLNSTHTQVIKLRIKLRRITNNNFFFDLILIKYIWEIKK